MQEGENPYVILGVPQNCDDVILQKAYRRLALSSHPERAQGDALQFAKIANAYELLKDPKMRHNYDLLQRDKEHGKKGYDPWAPHFEQAKANYEPLRERPLPPPPTIAANNPKYHEYTEEQGDGEQIEETWVTFTVMKNGKPVTMRRPGTQSYARSPTKASPKPPVAGRTPHSFQCDPLELFQQEFPEGWKAHVKMKKKSSSSKNPKTHTKLHRNNSPNEEEKDARYINKATKSLSEIPSSPSTDWKAARLSPPKPPPRKIIMKNGKKMELPADLM